MARFSAGFGIDTFQVDLNFYVRNYWDSEFFDNENIRYWGKNYQDVLVINGYDYEMDLLISFGGRDIRLNGDGDVVGGTVTGVIEETYDGSMLWRADGFTISAASVYRAALTRTDRDDRAIMKSILAGDDNVTLSAFSDRFEAGSGNDVVRAYGGSDTIFGQGGADRVLGFNGNDRLTGDAGNDTLIGGNGNDRLIGGSGHDRLSGGLGRDQLVGGTGNDRIDGDRGNDRLVGNDGADHFIFNRGDGNDRIVDFRPNIDEIVIDSGAVRFSQLDMYRSGGNTIIDFADVTVTLVGVRPYQMDQQDFLFI